MTMQTSIFLTDADRAAIQLIKQRSKVRAIAKQVCDETGMDYALVMGRCREAHICQVRHLIWAIAQQNGASLAQIGRVFNRDHTTILSGIQSEKRRRGEQA
ncbi:helix-turn-helix domain-containing protein [Paracoccus sp. SY]|uniref:helix-turn-helix domain-containing protein n=1 Tax=Paracoccus sp. SY TaxID=1330255 RepID=UPI000CD15929|nr:helix-turn-helix domain-containing protein [Paracoccus sp. SY]